jgi:hypothetical protein
MRTTLDIDAPVLRDLKRLQDREGQSLGRLASDLLAQALAERRRPTAAAKPFRWATSNMGVRVDLADSGAVLDAMDAADERKR